LTSLLLLWLAALGLLLVPGLDLPLRDWDEGIVARVALERAEALQALLRGDGSLTELLLPTYWGAPYLNKPPGLHLLSALPQIPWLAAEQLPPPWSVRLMPALLASAVVPLAGLISHELRPTNRRAAIASAAIALTLLPLMRHGRLAMLDGALVSASGLLWWQLLRCRWLSGVRALRPGLVAGLASSALLLLKAPLLLPVLLAGLVLLAMDRALSQQGWCWLLLGLGLGLLPGISWHLFHGLQRGAGALLLWGGDGAGRVLLDAGEGSDLGWRVPLLEVLEGGWPWLPLWPLAVAAAWRERRRPLGRWPLGLQLTTAAMVLPLRTQLPWYSHSLWLPFALLCGPTLAALIDPGELKRQPAAGWLQRIPWLWLLTGALLLIAAGPLRAYRPVLLPAALALLLGGWGLRPASEPRQRRWAFGALVGLWWLALLVLMQGPLWHWELNERNPVAPGAALARTADQQLPLALWGMAERPSLSWQSRRRLVPLGRLGIPNGELQLLGRQLPDSAPPIPEVAGHGCSTPVPGEDGWLLWRCRPAP
tara:strand:+ start:419 stop:2032 length:1614 start_codon:yes stop_codon:yes gene_type:complete